MNAEIYKKNIDKIRNKYPNWADFIENKCYVLDREVYVECDKAYDGNKIFRVSYRGKILYLNGKYNPAFAGEDWLKRVEKIDDFATVIIVGIHDAIHIRNILKHVKPTTNVMIYEPSINVFIKAIEEIDLTFLFEENIPVGLVVDGINEQELPVYFSKMINYDSMTMLKVYISPNYDKLFTLKVKKFVSSVKKYSFDIEKNWNTVVRYTTVNAENVFNNIKYLYEGYSIGSLGNLIPKNVPSIIVSAGPSLNKNILDLKNAVGKANIIATDTAMKPLLNAGIIPNFFVVVDGLKPGLLFEHKDISKVPMVTMTAISTSPMKIHKGKKFFYASDSMLEEKIMDCAYEKDSNTVLIPALPSGGSVANSAFSLARFMGSETIILVGQDLAMTGNKTHADGTFKDKMDSIDVESGEYFEIEAIDGGKVLTRLDFKMYLDWFEEQIKEMGDMRVIDATEGGAKIHGTEIMPLKEAIDRYCNRSYSVKYRVSRINPMLSDIGKEELLELFESAPDKLAEVKRKAEKGVQQYKKLEKISKKKQYSRNELDKLLKQLTKTNGYMENDYMAQVVNDSLKGIEMTLRSSIYNTKAEEKNELSDIAQNGIFMMQATAYAAEEMIGLAEKTMANFAKKVRKKQEKKDNLHGTKL